MQQRAVGGDGMDVIERAVGKDTADDAGYLERQLLLRREQVDAAGDDAVDGIGEGERRQFRFAGSQLAGAVFDDEQAGIAQGLSQLFAEEGVAARFLQQQLFDCFGKFFNSQAEVHTLQGIPRRQRAQRQVFRIGARQQSTVF